MTTYAERPADKMSADERRIQGDVVGPDGAAEALENLLDGEIAGTAHADFPAAERLPLGEQQAPDLR